MTTATFGFGMVAGVMVDGSVSSVDHQLQERMEVRVFFAGAHLDGEQDDETESEYAEREPAPWISSSASWTGYLEDLNASRHRVTWHGRRRAMSDSTKVGT